MNRTDVMFQKAAERNESCLMIYLPSIGPDLVRSNELVDMFIESGVDYIELGTPGGAPWLDGTPMQKNHLQSHQTGIDAIKALELGAAIRQRHPDFPILPMLYTSVVVRMGIERFIEKLLEAGMDGVELPDYPSYRMYDPLGYHKAMRDKGLYNINFCDGISLAEEGTPQYDLMQRIVTDVDGFLFLTATPGVTGATGGVNVAYLSKAVARIRQVMDAANKMKPIMVGFGLTTPEDVYKTTQEIQADAVVVGSAITRLIQNGTPLEKIGESLRALKDATLNRPEITF